MTSSKADGTSGNAGNSDPGGFYGHLFEEEKVPPCDDLAKINILFHRLWTKAVGTDSYNKREWKGLAQFLTRNKIYV